MARPDPLALNGAEALTAPLVTVPESHRRVVFPDNIDWHRGPSAPQAPPLGPDGRLPVREITGDRAGAGAPFGDDRELPLPPDKLDYQHPHAEDRD